jgi:hypothetical protein
MSKMRRTLHLSVYGIPISIYIPPFFKMLRPASSAEELPSADDAEGSLTTATGTPSLQKNTGLIHRWQDWFMSPLAFSAYLGGMSAIVLNCMPVSTLSALLFVAGGLSSTAFFAVGATNLIDHYEKRELRAKKYKSLQGSTYGNDIYTSWSDRTTGSTKSIPTSTVDEKANFRYWKKTIERYQSIVDRWVEYELDIHRVILYPMMSDPSVPTTAAFHRAYNNAQMYKPETIPAHAVEDSRFFAAVQELEEAFSAAEHHAVRSKWDGFEQQDRHQLRKAQDLLNIALDDSASESERHSAYKAARRALDGVLLLPAPAVQHIEHVLRLEIAH